MKRIIALLLCISMVFAMTACGDSNAAENDSIDDGSVTHAAAGLEENNESIINDESENAGEDENKNDETIDYGHYARDYGDFTYQETYTSMSERDFNAAVGESLICVHTNGGGEFKFYLDYDLNVLALHCDDWRAVVVMDNLEYIDMDMPFSKAVEEVYLRMYDIFPPDDWNVSMDIVATCGFASEGMDKIRGPIIDGVLNITNGLCIFPQTNFHFE